MREPRKIIGRRLVRREGESDAEYFLAATRHLQTLRLGRANLLRIAMERAVSSIGVVGDVSLLALTDIAGVLLKLLHEYQLGSASTFVDLRHEIASAGADGRLRLQDVVDDSLPVPFSLDDHVMQRDPGESDAEYEARRELFVTSRREITRRPGVMSGDWLIWGTRVRPEIIEAEITAGRAEEEILEAYPMLPKRVVAAVQRWRQHIDLIIDHDPGTDVLDYIQVELSPAGRAPIAYLTAGRGGLVPATAPEYLARDTAIEDDRLSRDAQLMAQRWERKQEIADEDLNWSEWQQRVDTPLPGHLKATGSGDLQVDLGYAQPGKTRLLVDLIRVLRAEIGKRHLTSDEVAVAAGMKSEEIDVLLRGVVRGRDVYDVLWILSRLSKRISISIEDADDSEGYIVVEHGQ